MKFTKTNLFAVASLAASLFTAQTAKADIMQNQSAVGAFSMDGIKTMTINFTSSTRTSGINGSSTTVGSFQVVGLSGNLALNISAQLYSVSTSKVVWSGVAYDQIHLLTKPFVYVDMKSGARIDAYATADLTKSGKGCVAIKVYRLSDDAYLAGTVDRAGTLMNAPFVSGAIGNPLTITLPNLPVN